MAILNVNRPKNHKAKAQGMVEFALALPVFLLLVLGVIEFGRLLMTYSAIYTASREAARFGAAVGLSGNGMPYYQDCVGIKDAAVRVGFMGGVTTGNVTVNYYTGEDDPTTWQADMCPGVMELGDRIAVRVQGNYQPIVPLVNLPSFPIVSIASRTIIQGVDIFGTPGPTITPKVGAATPTITKTHTATFTPTSTLTLTPTITYTPTHTHTPITPTTTDYAQQTEMALTEIAGNLTSTAAVATANAWATQFAATQTAQPPLTQTAAAIQTQQAALTSTAWSLTKTAEADCSYIVTGQAGSDKTKYSFSVSNTSTLLNPRNVSIQSITVSWNSGDTLNEILFDTRIWSVTQTGPTTLTITQFDPGAVLTLTATQRKTVTFVFSGNNAKVQLVQVQFDNSCPAVSPY